jgi:hypothetical protein
MSIAPDEEQTLSDRFGVVHDCEPGAPKAGNAVYGNLSRPAYDCGCQPLIHYFRCAACRRKVGWCYGGASDHAWENECCNGCVVTIWKSAELVGIDLDVLGAALDVDPDLRRHVYARMFAMFGGAS